MNSVEINKDESDSSNYQTRGFRLSLSPTNLPLNLGKNTDLEDNALSIHYELEGREPNGNSDFMMEEDNFQKHCTIHMSREPNGNSDFMMEENFQKLCTLHKSRGREIVRLVRYKEELKYEHREELSRNFNENLVLKYKNAQLNESKNQQYILIHEYEERIRTLVKKLEEVELKSENEIKNKEELILKLELAQSTVYSLEQQVAELENANLCNKNKEAEDRYHKKQKNCFEDNVTDLELQVRKLKIKLKESEESYAQSENKFKELKLNSDDVLAQKMDEINRLKKYSEHEKLYLQQNKMIKALEAKEKELQLNLKSTKHSLAVAVEHLDSYDRMNKFGVLKHIYQTEERSVDQMGLCKELKFEKSSITLDSNAIDKLKHELIKCLVSNQKCRKYIKSLQENVESKSKEVEYIKSKLKSHQDGSRITLPNHCSVVEENLHLKTLLNPSLNQFQHLKDKPKLFESRMGEIFTSIQSNEFKNIDSDLINLLINSIKTYAESIQLFNSSQQDYVEKIARDNAMLIGKPYMQLETSFENIDKRFVEFNSKYRYISKFSTSLTSSEIDNLKSIIEDFENHLHDQKKENVHTLKKNVQQKTEVCTLKSKLDDANLLLKKLKTYEEQKQDLLEKTKEKHNTEKQKLSFTSLQMKEQHEKKLESRRNQILELDKKISAVQNIYSTVSKEKNAIEDKYEALMLQKQFQLREIQLQEQLDKMKSEKCLLIENHKEDIKKIIDQLHAEDQKNMELKVQLNDIEAFYAKTIAELNKDINKDTKRIDALEAENKSKDEICEVVRIKYNRMKEKYIRFKESYEQKIAKLKEQKMTMVLDHSENVRRQLKDDYLAQATASIDELFVPIIDYISLLNRRCDFDLTSHIKRLKGLQLRIKTDLILYEDSLKIVQKVQQ